MKKEIKDLLIAFEWEEIHSKNPYMVSFKKEDLRMNYYQNGTLTIQGKNGFYYQSTDVFEPVEFEKIIEHINEIYE